MGGDKCVPCTPGPPPVPPALWANVSYRFLSHHCNSHPCSHITSYGGAGISLSVLNSTFGWFGSTNSPKTLDSTQKQQTKLLEVSSNYAQGQLSRSVE